MKKIQIATFTILISIVVIGILSTISQNPKNTSNDVQIANNDSRYSGISLTIDNQLKDISRNPYSGISSVLNKQIKDVSVEIDSVDMNIVKSPYIDEEITSEEDDLILEEDITKDIEISTPIIIEEYTGYIIGNNVNFREQPNVDCEVISRFNINTPVTYVIHSNNWVKICFDEEIGFVNRKYIGDEKVYVEPKIDLSCKQIYTYKQFKKLGKVKYGNYKYTYYSQNVLPGGGLKIPGRHVDENNMIADKDGYICVASGSLSKGTVVDTPLGKKGKVYDYCETPGTIDIYCNW